jgi:hypothetical protein
MAAPWSFLATMSREGFGWVSLAMSNIRLSSFNKLPITNALDDIEDGILWDNSDLNCPDLKERLQKKHL